MANATVHQATSRDGTAIGFSQSGSGRPLVLVHGTSANRARWQLALPGLERHFSVYAVDRRGRGSSGDAANYTLAREVEDVAAVVDAVARTADAPLVLLGHSWGGICALEAARSGQTIDALEALILYEPPIPVGVEIYPPGMLDYLARLLADGEHEAVLTTFLRDVVQMPADQLAAARAQPGWPDRVAAAHALVREVREHNGYKFDPERWRQLDVPTLLLLGGASPRFFGSAIEALHSALPSSTIRVLPGEGHAAMDTSPHLFVEEIVRFAGAIEEVSR